MKIECFDTEYTNIHGGITHPRAAFILNLLDRLIK